MISLTRSGLWKYGQEGLENTMTLAYYSVALVGILGVIEA
jgi:hypothetical protein